MEKDQEEKKEKKGKKGSSRPLFETEKLVNESDLNKNNIDVRTKNAKIFRYSVYEN